MNRSDVLLWEDQGTGMHGLNDPPLLLLNMDPTLHLCGSFIGVRVPVVL